MEFLRIMLEIITLFVALAIVGLVSTVALYWFTLICPPLGIGLLIVIVLYIITSE